jgi:glycosyltransferase involved in cell wall biosynthesis
MSKNELWSNYAELHRQFPRSDSEAKVDFYSRNSEFIIKNSKNTNPELAVIIPAYNESVLIPRTLASINQALENQSNINVFIVDNASTDDTAEIAKTFGAKVIKEPKKGIGQARQTGLESIPKSSKFILTTDADTIVPNQWINDYYKILNSKNIVFAYGNIKYITDQKLKFFDTLFLSIYLQSSKYIHQLKEKKGQSLMGANNCGFNKEIAFLVGGYNPHLAKGEDVDLMEKMTKHGDIIKINSTVLTSARRVLGEGIINRSLKKIKTYMFHGFKAEIYKSDRCEDYRDN